MNIGDFSPDYQIFYEYLMHHNALFPYLENCIMSKDESSNPIDTFLCWEGTPQGHAYWRKLNRDRPTVRMSSALFKQYCELYEISNKSYEFW